MSNNRFLKGAFLLALAGLISRFLGMFFKIPLQHMIQDEGMGLFGLPYPIYTVMLSISIIGFPAAISKMISEKIAIGDVKGAHYIFKVALLLLIFIGIFSSSFLYFGANTIISVLEWPKDAYYSIVGLSLAPFFVSIMSAFRGYFQGMQQMMPTALSQITEQVGRVIIGVLLAYYMLPRGAGIAAGAASFGAAAGAFLGCFILIVYYFLSRRSTKEDFNNDSKIDLINISDTESIIKEMIGLAIPISIGAILSSVMGVIDAAMVPSRLLQGGYTVEGATVLYGQLTGKALTLVNVPLTFSTAMAASLVPAISESLSCNRKLELAEKTVLSIKATIIIAMPAAIGLSLLATQIIQLLWGRGEEGGAILRILSFNVIFISLAQILASILQGVNKVFTPVRNLMLGIIVKILVSYYLLTSYLNILGAVIGSIAGYFIVMILNYWEVKKSIAFSMDFIDSFVKPLLATLIMAYTICWTYPLFDKYFRHSNGATLLSIFLGAIIYIILILVMGVFNIEEGKQIIRKD